MSEHRCFDLSASVAVVMWVMAPDAPPSPARPSPAPVPDVSAQSALMCREWLADAQINWPRYSLNRKEPTSGSRERWDAHWQFRIMCSASNRNILLHYWIFLLVFEFTASSDARSGFLSHCVYVLCVRVRYMLDYWIFSCVCVCSTAKRLIDKGLTLIWLWQELCCYCGICIRWLTVK